MRTKYWLHICKTDIHGSRCYHTIFLSYVAMQFCRYHISLCFYVSSACICMIYGSIIQQTDKGHRGTNRMIFKFHFHYSSHSPSPFRVCNQSPFNFITFIVCHDDIYVNMLFVWHIFCNGRAFKFVHVSHSNFQCCWQADQNTQLLQK